MKKIWFAAVFCLLVLVCAGIWRLLSPEKYKEVTALWRLPSSSLAVHPLPPPVLPPPAEPDPDKPLMLLDAVLAQKDRAKKELTPDARNRPKLGNLIDAKPPARAKPLRAEYPVLALYSPQVPIIKHALNSRQGCMLWPEAKECRGRALGGGLRADYLVSDTRVIRHIYNPSTAESVSETVVWFDRERPRVQDHLTHVEFLTPTCCWNVRWLFDTEGNIEKVEVVTENGTYGQVTYGPDGDLWEDSSPPDGPIPRLYRNRPRHYCDIHRWDREICG